MPRRDQRLLRIAWRFRNQSKKLSFETNNVSGKLESESPIEASFYQKPQQDGGN